MVCTMTYVSFRLVFRCVFLDESSSSWTSKGNGKAAFISTLSECEPMTIVGGRGHLSLPGFIYFPTCTIYTSPALCEEWKVILFRTTVHYKTMDVVLSAANAGDAHPGSPSHFSCHWHSSPQRDHGQESPWKTPQGQGPAEVQPNGTRLKKTGRLEMHSCKLGGSQTIVQRFHIPTWFFERFPGEVNTSAGKRSEEGLPTHQVDPIGTRWASAKGRITPAISREVQGRTAGEGQVDVSDLSIGSQNRVLTGEFEQMWLGSTAERISSQLAAEPWVMSLTPLNSLPTDNYPHHCGFENLPGQVLSPNPTPPRQ